MRWKLFSFFIVHLFTFLVFFSFVNVNKILDSYVFCFCLLNSFLRWSSFLLVALVWNIMLLLLLFLFFLKFSRGLCFRNFDRCWYCFFFLFFLFWFVLFSLSIFVFVKEAIPKMNPRLSQARILLRQTKMGDLICDGGNMYLYCIALYCTKLNCTVLLCAVLYCYALYCTVSFSLSMKKKNVLRDRQPKW